MKNIALHILDLIENATAAGASKVTIEIGELRSENVYRLLIEDDGKGMDANQLAQATDPFFTTRTTRKVGLGLPLIRMNTELTGGTFHLSSTPGAGTRLMAQFVYDHIDRLPAGELDDVLVTIMSGHPDLHLIYRHTTDNGTYTLDSAELKEITGPLSQINREIREFIRAMICENLDEINAEHK